MSSVASVLSTHAPISPALLNAGHSPQLVDVLCQLLSDALQVGWQHDLNGKKESQQTNTADTRHSGFGGFGIFNLNGVHGARGERGVVEGHGGTQQVAHAMEVVLVLLDGFNTHPVSGQQSLVARGVAGRGHELEVAMTTAK